MTTIERFLESLDRSSSRSRRDIRGANMIDDALMVSPPDRTQIMKIAEEHFERLRMREFFDAVKRRNRESRHHLGIDSMDMIEFAPEMFPTAVGDGCRYFGGDNVMFQVTGPPIQLNRFTLDRDFPQWAPIDPRHVDFSSQAMQVLLNWGPFCDDDNHRQRDRSLCGLRWLQGVIGEELWGIVADMPDTARPFLMIWLAQRVGEFRTLLLWAPMMAVMVVYIVDKARGKCDIESFTDAIRQTAVMPDDEILSSVNIPAKALPGFQKITPGGCDLDAFKGLRSSLRSPESLERFNQAESIGADCIHIFAEERLLQSVTDGFLRDLTSVERPAAPPYCHMLRTGRRLLTCAGMPWDKVFDTPGELDQWHRSIWTLMRLENVAAMRHQEFPMSPFADVPGVIEHIHSGRQLLREALEMHSYFVDDHIRNNRVADEECFLFSVTSQLGMERCTVEVTRRGMHSGRMYTLGEMVGTDGASVSPMTREAIRTWAENNGISICGDERQDGSEQLEFPYTDMDMEG